MKKLIVATLLTVVSMASAAIEIIDGVWWSYTVSNGKATIISGTTHCVGEITVPDTLCGYPVTSIGIHAFYNCSELTSVTIPSSVTYIAQSAFEGCSELKSVTIPSSVTSIGYSAFEGCSGLKTIFVALDNPSYASIDGMLCSKDGKLLISGVNGDVVIPPSVVSIGSRAFYGYSGLASVTIPSSVTSIGDEAFYGCSGLVGVTIPDGVTSIGSGAFHGCSGLRSVTIPSSVTCVGPGAFWDCSGLTSVTIPEGVTSIGLDAFHGCSGLKSVTIPSSVTDIGSRAFEGCLTVERIVLDPMNTCFRIKRGKLETRYGQVIIDCSLSVNVLSSQIRESDPTVMDVTYKIRSLQPTVKVRVLAFEDGTRSLAKVVRPETFVDGTGVNVGDAITPNVEHKISWRVSSDWSTKLAKVRFEVLASEGELLPLETMTIPASDQYGKMKITCNAISYNQVFDALLWLYADKDPGLTLSDGVLMHDGNWIAGDIPNLSHDLQPLLSYEFQEIAQGVAGMTYILSKMGYSLLTGAPLTYANQETRLGLSPSGARQYGYKIVE